MKEDFGSSVALFSSDELDRPFAGRPSTCPDTFEPLSDDFLLFLLFPAGQPDVRFLFGVDVELVVDAVDQELFPLVEVSAIDSIFSPTVTDNRFSHFVRHILCGVALPDVPDVVKGYWRETSLPDRLVPSFVSSESAGSASHLLGKRCPSRPLSLGFPGNLFQDRHKVLVNRNVFSALLFGIHYRQADDSVLKVQLPESSFRISP